jgi:hypothetical protein
MRTLLIASLALFTVACAELDTSIEEAQLEDPSALCELAPEDFRTWASANVPSDMCVGVVCDGVTITVCNFDYGIEVDGVISASLNER